MFKGVIDQTTTAYNVDEVEQEVYDITCRIHNYCEEIDNNIPEEERTGYDMLSDLHLIRDIVRKGYQ